MIRPRTHLQQQVKHPFGSGWQHGHMLSNVANLVSFKNRYGVNAVVPTQSNYLLYDPHQTLIDEFGRWLDRNWPIEQISLFKVEHEWTGEALSRVLACARYTTKELSADEAQSWLEVGLDLGFDVLLQEAISNRRKQLYREHRRGLLDPMSNNNVLENVLKNDKHTLYNLHPDSPQMCARVKAAVEEMEAKEADRLFKKNEKPPETKAEEKQTPVNPETLTWAYSLRGDKLYQDSPQMRAKVKAAVEEMEARERNMKEWKAGRPKERPEADQALIEEKLQKALAIKKPRKPRERYSTAKPVREKYVNKYISIWGPDTTTWSLNEKLIFDGKCRDTMPVAILVSPDMSQMVLQTREDSDRFKPEPELMSYLLITDNKHPVESRESVLWLCPCPKAEGFIDCIGDPDVAAIIHKFGRLQVAKGTYPNFIIGQSTFAFVCPGNF